MRSEGRHLLRLRRLASRLLLRDVFAKPHLPDLPLPMFRTHKPVDSHRTLGPWAGILFFKRACARIGTASRRAPWPNRGCRPMCCPSETTVPSFQSAGVFTTRLSTLHLSDRL